MKLKDTPLVRFLKEVMRRRKLKPSHLAAQLGISHATVSRWLTGADTPSPRSCRRLAEYCGLPVEEILVLAGHLSTVSHERSGEWPEFREYARKKYPNELDEDIITLIEDLIERRRTKKHEGQKRDLGT